MPRESSVSMAEEKRGMLRSKWFWMTLLVFILVAAAFVGGWWVTTSGSRAVVRLLDSYDAVYAGTDSTKDVAELLPLYADSAVMRDAALDRTYEGTDEIKTALNSLFATPDFDLTVEDTKVGSGWALVSWTADGTRPGTSRLAQVSGVTLLEISKNAIVRETWYYDPAKSPF